MAPALWEEERRASGILDKLRSYYTKDVGECTPLLLFVKNFPVIAQAPPAAGLGKAPRWPCEKPFILGLTTVIPTLPHTTNPEPF